MTASSGAAAVNNADEYTAYDVGMCLKWVRGPCWGIGSLYGSAIEAWNGAKFKHPGDRNPPAGAPMFYAGGKYGHVVIARGVDAGRMRSTDCQSSGKVGNAGLSWPVDNWGNSYLGWTEDLNGVRLPLASDTNEGDDMPQYDHATASKDVRLAPDEWYGVEWGNVPAGKAFTEGSKQAKLGGRHYAATFHVALDAPQGSTIRLRTVENKSGDLLEENPQTEALATGGTTYAEYSHNGGVSDGRTVAFRVSCSQAATLLSADVTVLSW